MLAYSSGADNHHVDINVMTAAGVHLRTLTDYEGRDESPDWQPIPAPDTERRCDESPRRHASQLPQGAPPRRPLGGRPEAARLGRRGRDFGGVTRVILTRGGKHGTGTAAAASGS